MAKAKEKKSDIGLIGLSVMGQNLALNIERNGFQISVFNRTAEITKSFAAQKTKGKKVYPCYSLKKFISSLKKPRKIILLIKAGEPVDEVIGKLLPLLEKGDILIDGGNSFFKDTERRQLFLEKKGIFFLGMGVSGGEEGALYGPSLMVGGSKKAYLQLEKIFKKIAAVAEKEPCCAYLGPSGAGHFVKMVHNGIEYAVMGLLAEVYAFLKIGLHLSQQEIINNFKKRRKSLLASYLFEITLEVLSQSDKGNNQPLVDLVLDEAEQKGTGKWTTQVALDLGIPLPGISSAVDSRIISSFRERREKLAAIYSTGKSPKANLPIQAVFDSLLASILVTYDQGFFLLRQGSTAFGYDLDLLKIAKIWRAGCIIRSEILKKIILSSIQVQSGDLLADSGFFRQELIKLEKSWRQTLSAFIESSTPCPIMAASLAYFDSFRQKRLESASLIQGLRDRFGSHGFRRTDKKGDFHVNWSPVKK